MKHLEEKIKKAKYRVRLVEKSGQTNTPAHRELARLELLRAGKEGKPTARKPKAKKPKKESGAITPEITKG